MHACMNKISETFSSPLNTPTNSYAIDLNSALVKWHECDAGLLTLNWTDITCTTRDSRADVPVDAVMVTDQITNTYFSCDGASLENPLATTFTAEVNKL